MQGTAGDRQVAVMMITADSQVLMMASNAAKGPKGTTGQREARLPKGPPAANEARLSTAKREWYRHTGIPAAHLKRPVARLHQGDTYYFVFEWDCTAAVAALRIATHREVHNEQPGWVPLMNFSEDTEEAVMVGAHRCEQVNKTDAAALKELCVEEPSSAVLNMVTWAVQAHEEGPGASTTSETAAGRKQSVSMVCMEEWALVIQGESTREEDQQPHHDPPEHHEMHATVGAQRKDPKLLAMVEYLQTKQWPKDAEVKEYIRMNNKAYRLGEHGQLLHLQQNTWGRRDGGQRWCLVVPEEVRHRVLKRAHEDVTGGHYAVYKTYHKIADRYYWT